MTTRRTTALILGLLLGTAVAAMMLRISPSFFALERLQDDFSTRKFMKDDPKEPIPTEDSGVVFFPPAERIEESEPELPAVTKPSRAPDPLRMPRTRSGATTPFDATYPKRAR
jgi:hypothetical protein